eukprot:509940-Prorocentrum_minimum.AAC.3
MGGAGGAGAGADAPREPLRGASQPPHRGRLARAPRLLRPRHCRRRHQGWWRGAAGARALVQAGGAPQQTPCGVGSPP